MHEPADTDPACVITVDCARGFTFLHWLNLRYGLHCFVFYGCIVVYLVPHKFVLTGKLIWFVHTSLGRQFFSGDRIASYSSPGTTEPTDRPSLCYKCRLCKRFCALTLVESSVGLYCFVFYGCIVVYSVPHKSMLTRKLIWPMSPMVCTCKFRSTSMSHTR